MSTKIDLPMAAVHKPCAFNPHGATEEMCRGLSRLPARASSCVGCSSKWKAQGVVPFHEAEVAPVRSSASAPVRARGTPTQNVVNMARVRLPTPSVATPVAASTRPIKPASLVRSVKRSKRVIRKDVSPPKPVASPKRPAGHASALERSLEDWKAILSRVRSAMANSVLGSLDPKKIRPQPGQPRKNFGESAMMNLRESIREVGQIQVGVVRPVSDGIHGVTHEILDGERRWRAVCAEGIPTYRAQIVEIDDEAAPFLVAAVSNFNREGHTPIEVSDAVEKLHNGRLKMPMRQIAELLGFTEFWVYQMHGLQNLHPDVRAMLDPERPKKQILPVTAAIHLSKLDPELQTDLALKVLTKKISLSRLRSEVVKTGEAHGKLVRTRTVRPYKLFESFQNRALESARIAEDMLAQLHTIRSRGLSYEGNQRVLAALDSAIHDLSSTRKLLQDE